LFFDPFGFTSRSSGQCLLNHGYDALQLSLNDERLVSNCLFAGDPEGTVTERPNRRAKKHFSLLLLNAEGMDCPMNRSKATASNRSGIMRPPGV